MYAQYFSEKEIKVCLLNNTEIEEPSANAEVLTKFWMNWNLRGLIQWALLALEQMEQVWWLVETTE